MLDEITSAPIWIDIVTAGQHQIERVLVVSFQHLSSNRVLVALSRAEVTQDREPRLVVCRPQAEDRRRFEEGSGGQCCKRCDRLSSRYECRSIPRHFSL